MSSYRLALLTAVCLGLAVFHTARSPAAEARGPAILAACNPSPSRRAGQGWHHYHLRTRHQSRCS